MWQGEWTHPRADLPVSRAFSPTGGGGGVCLKGEEKTGEEAFRVAEGCLWRWMAVTAGLEPGVLAPCKVGW